MCNLKQIHSVFSKLTLTIDKYNNRLNKAVPFYDAGEKATDYLEIILNNIPSDIVTSDMFKLPFNNIIFECQSFLIVIEKINDVEKLNITVFTSLSYASIKPAIILDFGFFGDDLRRPTYSINKILLLPNITNKWVDASAPNNLKIVSRAGYNPVDEIVNSIPIIIKTVVTFLKLLNHPKIFIVEERKIVKIGNKNKKIEKVIGYHFDTSRDFKLKLRQTLNPEKGDPKGPLEFGHERRGHWREFRSDWFKNKKGKRTWIDAMWVGPESFTDPKDPNKKYKVRLDL